MTFARDAPDSAAYFAIYEYCKKKSKTRRWRRGFLESVSDQSRWRECRDCDGDTLIPDGYSEDSIAGR